jgi:hypothetical protein
MLFSRVFDRIAILRSLSFRVFQSSPIAVNSKEFSVHVLEETLKALTMSNRVISSLTLGTGNSHDYDAWFRLCDLHAEILTVDKNLARAFKDIDTMELGFNAVNLPTDVISKFPAQILNMTPNLKNLELSIIPIAHHSSLNCLATFADIATSTSLTKLVQVDICATELTTETLRAFLSASKRTLRKVQIIDVKMQESPEMKLKPYIKHELTLDVARLKNVTDANGEVWIVDVKLVDGAWIQPVKDESDVGKKSCRATV